MVPLPSSSTDDLLSNGGHLLLSCCSACCRQVLPRVTERSGSVDVLHGLQELPELVTSDGWWLGLILVS